MSDGVDSLVTIKPMCLHDSLVNVARYQTFCVQIVADVDAVEPAMLVAFADYSRGKLGFLCCVLPKPLQGKVCVN